MHPFVNTYNSEQLQKLMDIVLKAVPAEKIFLLGSTLRQRRTVSIFSETAPTARRISHFYLLVLVKEDEQGYSQLKDKIENNCCSFTRTTVIVLNAKQFYSWLKQGQPFACTVQRKAYVLYSTEQSLQEEANLIIDVEATTLSNEKALHKE